MKSPISPELISQSLLLMQRAHVPEFEKIRRKVRNQYGCLLVTGGFMEEVCFSEIYESGEREALMKPENFFNTNCSINFWSHEHNDK